MLKFFRVYNKAILGVGFVFLMIIFLLPSGVSRLVGDPRNRPAYKYADKGVITQGEIVQASQDLQFLEQLHPAFLKVLLGVNRPEHWILLTREAEAAGFVGGPDDGRNSLSQLAQTFTDFELNQIYRGDYAKIFSLRDDTTKQMYTLLEAQRARAINRGQPADAVDRILAQAHGVVRMYASYLKSQTLSGPELIQSAQDAISSVTVRYQPISASNLVDDETPEPTEEEILKQFETYKSVRPRTGKYGFGYLRQPAVKLEWMIVSKREIEQTITLDPVDVNVYWHNNQKRFGDNFDEARPRIEKEMRDQQVQRALDVAKQVAKGQFLREAGNLEQDDDGYRILPDDWVTRRPSFDAIAHRIAEAIKTQLGMDIVPPDTLSDPRWLTGGVVTSLGVIGTSQLTYGRNTLPFTSLVFSVPETGVGGGSEDLKVQTGLAFNDPTIASNGDLCFFRVDEARPDTPPDSVDDVRQQIVNDLKRLAEYKVLLDDMSDILSTAREKGIEEASLPYDANLIYPDVVVTHNRITQRTNASSEDLAALRDAVLAQAAKIDPTIPIDEAPYADRVVLEAQPSILSLVLIEISKVAPMSRETFQTVARQALSSYQSSLRNGYEWPFTLESMTARLHVVSTNKSKDNDADAVADSANDSTTADDADSPAEESP